MANQEVNTLKTKHGIKVDVRSIETFTDNAVIRKFSPYHHSTGDYVDGFEVNIEVDATLADGTSKSFTVVFQSADRSNKLLAHGLADMWFAQHYGADWDESGKLAEFVYSSEDCYKDWDEIAEFLTDIAESECKKWYDDNKDEGKMTDTSDSCTIMEWENKTKMVQLGNQRYKSDEAKKEFQNFVLENINSFDGQAWDMFCNLVDLIVDEMKKDLEFWKQVYAKIKYVDCNDEKFGLRSGMRIAMIQTICEDELSLS